MKKITFKSPTNEINTNDLVDFINNEKALSSWARLTWEQRVEQSLNNTC